MTRAHPVKTYEQAREQAVLYRLEGADVAGIAYMLTRCGFKVSRQGVREMLREAGVFQAHWPGRKGSSLLEIYWDDVDRVRLGIDWGSTYMTACEMISTTYEPRQVVTWKRTMLGVPWHY